MKKLRGFLNNHFKKYLFPGYAQLKKSKEHLIYLQFIFFKKEGYAKSVQSS